MNGTWIFQGHPDIFDVDGYVASADDIVWSIKQEHLADRIDVGDTVYLWRAKGKTKQQPGIIAMAMVTEHPRVQADDSKSKPFWRSGSASAEHLRVRLRVLSRARTAHHVVTAAALREEPILRGHRILTVHVGTNFEVSPDQAGRLRELWHHTGPNWSEAEALAGLWAYAMTRGQAISRKPGSPVVHVARLTGRSISATYNKIMNFRSLDPSDSRKGLAGAAAADRMVWKRYAKNSGLELDLARLAVDFQDAWGGSRDATATSVGVERPTADEYPPEAENDPDAWQTLARRIRRGQPAFRRRLLWEYGETCAVSGWGPASVLQAAHIIPHAIAGVNEVDNGLLLRADIHELFDDHLLWVDVKSLTVQLAAFVANTRYGDLVGARLKERRSGGFPIERLAEHAQQAMGGADRSL